MLCTTSFVQNWKKLINKKKNIYLTIKYSAIIHVFFTHIYIIFDICTHNELRNCVFSWSASYCHQEIHFTCNKVPESVSGDWKDQSKFNICVTVLLKWPKFVYTCFQCTIGKVAKGGREGKKTLAEKYAARHDINYLSTAPNVETFTRISLQINLVEMKTWFFIKSPF